MNSREQERAEGLERAGSAPCSSWTRRTTTMRYDPKVIVSIGTAPGFSEARGGFRVEEGILPFQVVPALSVPPLS